MRNILNLFFVFTFCLQLSAQTLEIIIPGSVTNYESKAKIFGATLYLVQDGVTLSKTITTNTGEYNIVSKINKKIPFELIISKPNYITKKVYFDFKTITTRGQDPSVQAVSELVVELFATKKGVSITVGPSDYAEKFTWDNDQKIAVPDEQYKKMSDDKIINFYKESENNAIVSILITKADASARAGNYQNALSYADSALTVKQNDSIILKKKVDYQKGWDALIANEKKAAEIVVLLREGDELIKLDKLPEATTKFNEVIKKDPANAEAKKQLDIIKGLVAAKASQTKDAQELIKLRSNADKFITKKQYSDAILELNKAAERIFGEKTGSISGSLLTSRVLVRDHPKLLRLFSEDGAKEGDASPELNLYDDRGFNHVIKITTWKQATPERGGGFFVVARDLTALKAMEATWPKASESEPLSEAGPPFPRLGSNDIWFRGE